MSTYTESWLSGPQSTQIYTRTYKAVSPKAILVFVHGFIEHIGRYEHVHSTFAARNITVFTFDQRGFGQTATNEKHKSKESAYGKTSRREQLADIEWALKYAKSEFGELPLFLMGHSMGGALVLAIPTQPGAPPEPSTVSLLQGVIATSPLIQQTHPASKAARWLGGKASVLFPNITVPAPVNAKDLSHDSVVNEAYMKDPLVKHFGSLRGIGDMLNGGEQLLSKEYQRWPKTLPLLLIHGTEDQVTSTKASVDFHSKVPAEDKKISLYTGGFHELQNEPDGVKEKLVEECITWIDIHLQRRSSPTSKL